jgi:hypothetical protein
MERGEDDRTATFDKNGIPTIELINSCLIVIGVYICNRAACKQRQARGHTPPTYLHLKQVFFEKSEKGREKNDEP